MTEEKQIQDTDELIREIIAIASKPDEEFEGGEAGKIEAISQKLKTPAEDEDDTEPADVEIEEESADEDDTEEKTEDEDDEGGSKTEDDDDETEDEDDTEEKTEDEDDDEDNKPVSMDSAIKYIAKRDRLVSKIKPLIGDNVKYPAMSIKEVVKYACDKLDIKPTLDCLEGYIKGHSKKQNKVMLSQDNALSHGTQSRVIKDYLSK